MTLIHTTQAGYIYQPDVYTDEHGRRFIVQPDTDAEDPRSWVKPSEVAIVVIDADRHTRTDSLCDYDSNPAIALFIEMLDENESDDPLSIDLDTWRKALAERNIDYDVTIETCHGYSQSDWFTVLAAAASGYGEAQGWVSDYRMWAFGDVWRVAPDYDTDDEPLSGIYADSPEEAVRYYITDYSDNSINNSTNNENDEKEVMPS